GARRRGGGAPAQVVAEGGSPRPVASVADGFRVPAFVDDLRVLADFAEVFRAPAGRVPAERSSSRTRFRSASRSSLVAMPTVASCRFTSRATASVIHSRLRCDHSRSSCAILLACFGPSPVVIERAISRARAGVSAPDTAAIPASTNPNTFLRTSSSIMVLRSGCAARIPPSGPPPLLTYNPRRFGYGPPGTPAWTSPG